MKRNFTVLAIDTSCDETAAAVIVGERIYSNVISSQVELHKKWGGVVPIIAQRAHKEKIDFVITEAIRRFFRNSKLERSNSKQISNSKRNTEIFKQATYKAVKEYVDAIAVTVGPGLAPALEVGVAKAKELATQLQKPLISVNHMEAHLLSPFAQNSNGKNLRNSSFEKIAYPLLALLVSGGHTELVYVKKIGSYTVLGQTLDDAAGEAFDKVAKLLNLGYPGGPIIEYLARSGDPNAFDLPVPMKGRKDCDFSFSGLKTAVRYLVEDLTTSKSLNKQTTYDICASFQRVVASSISDRLTWAISNYKPQGILLGGGVFSNTYIRSYIRKTAHSHGIPVFVPYTAKLYTDNAGMVGIAAYYKTERDGYVENPQTLDRIPNLSL